MEQLDIVKFEQCIADCAVEELSSGGLVLLREKNPAAFDVMMDAYHQYNSGRIAISSKASMLMSKIDSAKKFTNVHELCANSAMLTSLFLHMTSKSDFNQLTFELRLSNEKDFSIQTIQSTIDSQTMNQLTDLNVSPIDMLQNALFKQMSYELAKCSLLNSKNQQ
jgi:hypothetical protein